MIPEMSGQPLEESAFVDVDVLPEQDQGYLAEILDEYLLSLEKGVPVSPAELFGRYPQYAPYLKKYLSGLNLFHKEAVTAGWNGPLQNSLVVIHSAGDRLGDFEILREIGRGGMGVVYEARQFSLQRRVALKVLPFSAGHDVSQIARFKNEAQAAAQIRHPNIVSVYAIGEVDGIHYYAMQLIEGQSITQMLSELRRSSHANRTESIVPERLTPRRIPHSNLVSDSQKRAWNDGPVSSSGARDHVRVVARLGVQAAHALHAAHEVGVLHRDIKPSNMLLDDCGKLWITDFGLARCRDHAGLTLTGDILGTMRYMSPEQALGNGSILDRRTDVYSLGVTLYELATLHHPSEHLTDAEFLAARPHLRHKPPRHWNPHIAADFETIVMKAISDSLSDRYRTAQELADDLTRYLEGKPILARPPSLLDRAGKWARRHRKMVYAGAALLLVAFCGQSYNTFLLSRENAAKESALKTAENYLHQTHSILERFGTRLVDQLAAIPGADGVRLQLLEDSLSFYQEFAVQAANEPELETDLALAYSKMGILTDKMGHKQEALAKHFAGLQIWKKKFSEEPSIQNLRQLILCQNNVGMLLLKLNRGEEAIHTLQQAEGAAQEFDAENVSDESLAAGYATTLNNLGLALRHSGDPHSATGKFHKAIQIQERLTEVGIEGSEQREDLLRRLAASYANLASLDFDSSIDEAIDVYQKAVAIQRRLVQNRPVNRLYQVDLASTYNNLGYALAQASDWTDAEISYSNAIQIQRNLVKASPGAASYRRDLAISLSNLGMVQTRCNRYLEAEASFQEALRLHQLLLDADCSDCRLLSNMGGVYNNLALLCDQQGRFEEAEAAFRQAIHLQRQAHDASPTAKLYVEMLQNHYANYAKCLQNQSKSQEADAILHESQSLLAEQVPS